MQDEDGRALSGVNAGAPMLLPGSRAARPWSVRLPIVPEVKGVPVIRETVSHLRDLPRYRQILSTPGALRLSGRGGRASSREGLSGRSSGSRWATRSPPRTGRAGSGSSARISARPSSSWGSCSAPGPTCSRSRTPTSWPLCVTMCDRFSFAQVETILSEEYGRPLTELFASIDETAVASASISQVHRAVVLDGRIVALKVRRPEIAKVVRADLDIIKNLAQLVERSLPNLAVYRPLASRTRIRAHHQARARLLDRAPDHAALPDPVRRRPDRAHPAGHRGTVDAERDRDGVYRGGLGQRSGRDSSPARRAGGSRRDRRGSCSDRSSNSGSFTPTHIPATSASWRGA